MDKNKRISEGTLATGLNLGMSCREISEATSCASTR